MAQRPIEEVDTNNPERCLAAAESLRGQRKRLAAYSMVLHAKSALRAGLAATSEVEERVEELGRELLQELRGEGDSPVREPARPKTPPSRSGTATLIPPQRDNTPTDVRGADSA